MGTSEGLSQAACDRCGAPVTEHDLRQGLAVRIARDIVCPVCVDALPGDAQLKINQLRAMRGMDSTTYRVHKSEHPKANFFTFSTTANLLRHRHNLRDNPSFDVPPLPKQQRTVSHRHEAANAAQQAQNQTRRQQLQAYWPAAAIAAVLLVLGIVWAVSSNDIPEPLVDPAVEEQARLERIHSALAAIDDPLQAWQEGAGTYKLTNDDPLMADIFANILEQRKHLLDQASQAVDDLRLSQARELLAAPRLPEADRRFIALNDRHQALRQRLQSLEAPPANLVPALVTETDRGATDSEEPTTASESGNARDNDKDNALAAPVDPPETTSAPSTGAQDEEQITDSTVATDGSQPSAPTPATNADMSNLRAFQDPITYLWMATADQEPWDATLQGGKERVALRGQAGILTRSIDLPAGAWRIWLNGYNKHQGAILSGQWGNGQQLSNSSPRSGSYQWLAMDGVLRLTEPTTVDLLLSFVTPDLDSAWFIRQILIAEEGLTDPSLLADGQAQAGAWTPIKPPEPEAPPITTQTITFDRLPQGMDAWSTIPHWNSRYLTQPRLSPSISRAATELPYHVGDSFAESIRFDQLQGGSGGRPVSRRDGHFTVLQLAQPVDLSTGQISLLIFPNHRGRRQLELRLLDQRGIAAPHPLMVDVDPEAGWDVAKVTIPEGWLAKALAEQAEQPAGRNLRHAAIDPRRIKTLAVVDPKTSNSLSFYLGAVGLTPSEAPSPESMWRPRALLRANVPNLSTLRERQIDPDKIRILYGHQFNDKWKTDVRAAFAELLKVARLPNGSVAALKMNNAALDEEFIKEYLGDVQHHVVVVITAGVEFHTGQNRKQALINFWVKMMDEARRSDFLPVVVLGPTKVNEQFVAEADLLWEELETLISNDPRFEDVPIIDLRPATAIGYEQFAPGGKQMSLDLLTQGYAELRARLRSVIP